MFIATDFSIGVIQLPVEPRLLTPGDDAVGFGRGFIPLNFCFLPFNPCRFATGQRPVLQTIRDSVLLTLFALVYVGRVSTIMMNFSAGVIQLPVEPRALAPGDDAVRLGRGLIPLNLRFLSFNPRGFPARN